MPGPHETDPVQEKGPHLLILQCPDEVSPPLGSPHLTKVGTPLLHTPARYLLPQ